MRISARSAGMNLARRFNAGDADEPSEGVALATLCFVNKGNGEPHGRLTVVE
jgi:hypothetical protein